MHRRENEGWQELKSGLRRDFGSQTFQGNLEQALDKRAYREGESLLRYTEDVLYMCRKVDQKMSEETKLLYLISGFTGENLYTFCDRNFSTVSSFIEQVL